MNGDFNFSKAVFESQLGTMKNILKLMEFKFGGRDSEQYKYIKEQVMNYFYEAMKKFFLNGVDNGMFEKCSCGLNIRHGWQKECNFCAGSGFRDKKNKEK